METVESSRYIHGQYKLKIRKLKIRFTLSLKGFKIKEGDSKKMCCLLPKVTASNLYYQQCRNYDYVQEKNEVS